MSDNPRLKMQLRNYARSYQDLSKQFLLPLLDKICWIRDTQNKKIVTDIFLKLEAQMFEPREFIQRAHGTVDELIIIISGEAEVIASFDGDPYVIERLG